MSDKIVTAMGREIPYKTNAVPSTKHIFEMTDLEKKQYQLDISLNLDVFHELITLGINDQLTDQVLTDNNLATGKYEPPADSKKKLLLLVDQLHSLAKGYKEIASEYRHSSEEFSDGLEEE